LVATSQDCTTWKRALGLHRTSKTIGLSSDLTRSGQHLDAGHRSFLVTYGLICPADDTQVKALKTFVLSSSSKPSPTPFPWYSRRHKAGG
ncbi:hypothetical protein Bpfe_023933, partial [Biomphalaria pfeifferi]